MSNITKKQWVIEAQEDVKKFFEYLRDFNLVFHPDDDFLQYIDLESDIPTFTIEEGKYLNSILDKCHIVCGDMDEGLIYQIGMEVFYPEIANNEKQFLDPKEISSLTSLIEHGAYLLNQ